MEKKGLANLKHIRSIIVGIAAVNILLMVAVAVFLSYTILRQCETAISGNASSLISVDSRQLQLNVNSYLSKIENNVSLLYSDEKYYLYDETSTTLEEYDKLQHEKEIKDRIVDLGLMENYADFCVVYRDNHTVGWLSKTMENMYVDGGMYEDLSSYLIDENQIDAWCFGLKDNYERVYYIKRLNENAVLVASFYTNELENAFDYPEELKGLTVRLVNQAGQIIYSSKKDEIAQMVPEEQMQYVVLDASIQADLGDLFINTHACDNDWVVMCIYQKNSIMEQLRTIKSSIIHVLVVVCVFSALVSCLFMIRLSRPVDSIVEGMYKKASFDELSGVMNKASFTDAVKNVLEKDKKSQMALIMIDMDNFKQINDNLGHAYGDQVISRMGKLLSDCFASDDVLIGRVGGDEFSMLFLLPMENRELALKMAEAKVNFFKEAFDVEFEREREELNVSLSIGIASTFTVERYFDDLYNAADHALYISKNNGKNQVNIYSESGVQDEDA